MFTDLMFKIVHFPMLTCVFIAEKVFASIVPKCIAENCSGVVKPGEILYSFTLLSKSF